MNYREFYDKQYLAGEDFKEDESRIYTIKSAGPEEVESDRGPQEKLVISFEETDKKYIPGIRMAKIIGTIAGSKQIEDWNGTVIQLNEVQEKNFGELMSVIRISKPTDKKLMNRIAQITSAESMKELYQSLSSEQKTSSDVIKAMQNQKKQYK